jgi:16S rRNA (guanine527-N7)-methyltransferase
MTETLLPYGVEVGPRLYRQILCYMSLLQRWNRRISLTTITDPLKVLQFHFGETFFAAVEIPISDGRLADVGSGAGFPGLALKLLRPRLQVVLIESNLKKCAFLSEVIRNLELENAEVIRGRMENSSESLSGFDFVTARAIGNRSEVSEFSNHVLSGTGRIILWLGERDVIEMEGCKSFWKWRPPMKIPGSDRRFLLVGKRNEL